MIVTNTRAQKYSHKRINYYLSRRGKFKSSGNYGLFSYGLAVKSLLQEKYKFCFPGTTHGMKSEREVLLCLPWEAIDHAQGSCCCSGLNSGLRYWNKKRWSLTNRDKQHFWHAIKPKRKRNFSDYEYWGKCNVFYVVSSQFQII